MIRIHVCPTQLVQAADTVSRIVTPKRVQRNKNWHDDQGKMEEDLEEDVNITEKEEGVKAGLL